MSRQADESLFGILSRGLLYSQLKASYQRQVLGLCFVSGEGTFFLFESGSDRGNRKKRD